MRAARFVQGAEPSALAMLLQMVLEKLSKAAMLRSRVLDVARATSSHAAARRLFQHLVRDRRACRHLRWKPEVVAQHVVPLVEQLERSQPQLAPKTGPLLEYPWKDASGNIRWPAEHHPVVRSFGAKTGSSGHLVFRFVQDLCERFDAVFP